MEQYKKQNNTVFSQLKSSKNKIQILLLFLLSVLAFFSSQYSSLLFSYLSSIKIFSYSSTDRHYIFLICNGLMLLVIKTSGLFATPAPPGTEFYRDSHVITKNVQLPHHQSSDFNEDNHVNNNVSSGQSNELIDVKLNTDELSETKAETKTEVKESKRGMTVMDQGGAFVKSTAHYEDKYEVNDVFNRTEEQEEDDDKGLEFTYTEEEEEQEVMLWSTEELNKKCDEFIRKMKYGIKYEAPLVMV